MHNIKNELGHRYGDYLVIAITDEREPSNKCVKWRVECIHCGHQRILNGNHLRMGTTRVCPNCRRKRRWKRFE